MAAPTDLEREAEDTLSSHPGVGEYVQIGVILAVLTAIEVALFYADVPRAITIPALLFLTAMKFALVVLWFMHLRFDHRLFRRVFFFGVVLAAVLFSVVAAIFYFGRQVQAFAPPVEVLALAVGVPGAW